MTECALSFWLWPTQAMGKQQHTFTDDATMRCDVGTDFHTKGDATMRCDTVCWGSQDSICTDDAVRAKTLVRHAMCCCYVM